MSLLPNDPIADLKKNPFAPSNGLKYPSTLGSSRYGHWINFTAMVPTSSKYKGQTSQQLGSGIPNLSNMEKGLNNLGSATASGVGSLVQKAGEALTGIPSSGIASSISNSLGFLGSVGTGLKDVYSIITSLGSVSPTDSISLYTPDSISLSQLTSYSSISKTEALGKVGLGAEAMGQMGSTYDKIKEGSGLGKESLMGSTFNNPMVGEGIGKLGQSAGVLGEGASQMSMAKGGYAINPQLEVIFKQVEFRTYQFNFTFTPKNAQEAQTVKEIIKQFRFHQLPELDQGGAGRYFIVPSFFQLEHIFQGNENTNLHKFAPCVLQSVFIDYAPNGWLTYEDAFPVQTTMVLAFQEIEIMTKERIKEGY